MVGIEIIDPAAGKDASGQPQAHPALASAIQASCLRHGLILELGGRHGSVVRLLPPLVITDWQVDLVIEIFATAMQEAVQEVSHKLRKIPNPPVADSFSIRSTSS
jgi:diaminobutyrate-2-oxoglutarate transaminase